MHRFIITIVGAKHEENPVELEVEYEDDYVLAEVLREEPNLVLIQDHPRLEATA